MAIIYGKINIMSALTVAVIATAGFSPFHFSVPCIIFGQSMPQPDLFRVEICAENPGVVLSDMGFSINVEHGLELLDTADIVIVPYWNHPEEKPSQALLDALINAWQRGSVAAWQRGSVAQKWWDFVWALTYWPIPAYLMGTVLPRTGSSNRTSLNDFQLFIWTATHCIPVMNV
ncbi:hypothetical protein EC847_103432 [Scandinavium goeteborgense]|uniref:Uncharacterized protein n=1 Tax=Scandinavium goeteborgense TaxID=1851514 RepID=A0A4R6EMK4_SCAGO|nr:hypothetical protein EC847_103432 [Scandinavium goeteborgense]